MDENKNGLYMMAIVAIVAVVGIVTMILFGAGAKTATISNVAEDSTGQVMQVVEYGNINGRCICGNGGVWNSDCGAYTTGRACIDCCMS